MTAGGTAETVTRGSRTVLAIWRLRTRHPLRQSPPLWRLMCPFRRAPATEQARWTPLRGPLEHLHHRPRAVQNTVHPLSPLQPSCTFCLRYLLFPPDLGHSPRKLQTREAKRSDFLGSTTPRPQNLSKSSSFLVRSTPTLLLSRLLLSPTTNMVSCATHSAWLRDVVAIHCCLPPCPLSPYCRWALTPRRLDERGSR